MRKKTFAAIAALALSIFAVEASAQQTPDPVTYSWGTDPMEQLAVWEPEGAERIVIFLTGGGWSQNEVTDFFDPANPQMPPNFQSFLDNGIAVGLAGYQTTVFPLPELTVGDLVFYCRFLGFSEVDLLGRSAGAHMSMFNGVVELNPLRSADRVCTIQQPLAVINLFDPQSGLLAWDHFHSVDGTVNGIPSFWSYYGSSAVWPTLIPGQTNQAKFCVIGQPKPWEAAIPTLDNLTVPLPFGVLGSMDAHSAISADLQFTALAASGYDAHFVDTFSGGLNPVDAAVDWLINN